MSDATRATTIRKLPRYVNFQLKRFVFEYQTMTRRKVTDAFEFPLAVDLAPFVERDGVDPDPDPDPYDLAFILVHRGQNATSGHYVALVREDFESTEPGGGAWWRFDDDVAERLAGGPFGEPNAAAGAREKKGEKKATKSPEDPADGNGDGDKDKDKARASTPKPSFGTRAAPKKGRDGSSLGEDAFASSDAYTLTYRRRRAAADDDGGATRSGTFGGTSAPGGSRRGGSRGRRRARGDDGDVRGARSGRTRADRGATRVRARGGGGGARRRRGVDGGGALSAEAGRRRSGGGLRDRGASAPIADGPPPQRFRPRTPHFLVVHRLSLDPRGMDTFVLRRRRRPRSAGRLADSLPARSRRPVARLRDQTRLGGDASRPRRRRRGRGRFPDASGPRCCVSTVSPR